MRATQRTNENDKYYDIDAFLCAAAYLISRGYEMYIDFDETNAWPKAVKTYQDELRALEGKPN